MGSAYRDFSSSKLGSSPRQSGPDFAARFAFGRREPVGPRRVIECCCYPSVGAQISASFKKGRPIAEGGRLSALRVAGRILGRRSLAMPFRVCMVDSKKRTAMLRKFQRHGAHGTTAPGGENEPAILDRSA